MIHTICDIITFHEAAMWAIGNVLTCAGRLRGMSPICCPAVG